MANKTSDGKQSWSNSRAQIMASCQRQFYFNYCVEARWNHPDSRIRDLHLLKQVKPIAMWKGDIVHQSIAEYFRNLEHDRILKAADVIGFAQQLAKQQWAFSLARRYRTQNRYRAGRAFAALFEHEYNIEKAESFDEASQHINACIANFFKIDNAEGISKSFLQSDDRLIEPPAWGEGATTFEIPGVQVMVKVDLAFRTKTGGYEILDWKTGKALSEDAAAQLELYILWAHLSLAHPLESIAAREVSLHASTCSRFRLSEPGKFYRLAAVRRSVDLISALTAALESGEADIRDFSYTKNVSACRRCSLQRVCQEFL